MSNALQSGQVQYFYIEDWAFVNEYKHAGGMRAIYPDASGKQQLSGVEAMIAGTRALLVDEARNMFVYNPVNDALESVPLPALNGGIDAVLWNCSSLDRVSGFQHSRCKQQRAYRISSLLPTPFNCICSPIDVNVSPAPMWCMCTARVCHMVTYRARCGMVCV